MTRLWDLLVAEPFRWIFLVFFQPRRFEREFESQYPRRIQRFAPLLRLIIPMFLTALPLAIIGRAILLPSHLVSLDTAKILLSIVVAIASGIVVGIVLSFTGDTALGIASAIASGIIVGIVLSFTGDIALGIAVSIAFFIVGGIALGIVGDIVVGIALGIVGGIAGGILGGIVVGIVVGIAT